MRVLAFVMLLLCTFSITPKKYLHDWIADHRDFYSFNSGDQATFSQAGFHCPCEDLVVSVPFIEASFDENLPAVFIYAETSSFLSPFLYLKTPVTKDSRGPPSLI